MDKKEYRKEYYQRNKDKIMLYSKNYNLTNADQISDNKDQISDNKIKNAD